MKCFLRRTVYGLASDDEQGEQVLRGIKIGEHVAVEVVKERNLKHHRLFWVMVTKLANALDMRPKVVADILKIKTGHYTIVELRDGTTQKIPESISWAAMDQIAFRQFFDECCKEICFEWLPHMTPGRWRKEVLQMMGVDWQEEDDGNANSVQHQNAR